MSVDRDPSVAELKRKVRAEPGAALTNSIDVLRLKISDTTAEIKTRMDTSANIKEEVKDHLRSSGKDFVTALKRKAKQSAAQALAVGAGVAYPLSVILRSIPDRSCWSAPLTALLHQSHSGSVEGQVTARASENAAKAGAAIQDAAAEGMENLSQTAASVKPRLPRTPRRSGTSCPASAQAMLRADSREELARRRIATATSMTEAASKQMAAAGKQVVDAKDGAVALGRRSGSALLQFIDRNPALVAGVGLAVGAFVASAVRVG